MPAVWTELLQAVQGNFQALGLTYVNGAGMEQELPSDRVYRRKLPNNRNTTAPCLIVCQGDEEVIEAGSFEDIEVIYPVVVIAAFPTNQDLSPLDDALMWRQQMLDAMDRWQEDLQPLVTTAEVIDCEIDTDPVIDLTSFEQANVDWGGMEFRFRTLRGRVRD